MSEKSLPGSAAGRLAWNTAIVMGSFVASRAVGLIREMVIGGQFGTTPQYDAYVAAFRIPDTLFLLITGGALGSAFIPVFAARLAHHDHRGAWRLTNSVLNLSLLALALAALVTFILAQPLVDWFIAPGLDLEQRQLAAQLTRVLLLSPLFLGLGTMALNVLNAHERFALTALAPVVYNAAIVAGAVFLAPTWGASGLAWGVAAGSLLYLVVQLPGLRRVGYHYDPTLALDDAGVREVGTLLLPRLLGQGAFQLNFVVMTSLASHLQAGSISALNYAYLLIMLPLGVFGISLGTVLFPRMARRYAEAGPEGVAALLMLGLRAVLFFLLPATAGIILLRTPLIQLVFQFRAFTAESTDLVSAALLAFAVGLVAFGLIELLTRGFYAVHDTRTPVTIALASVVLNIALALVLGGPLGHAGLALALSLASIAEMVALLIAFRRRAGPLGGRRLARAVGRLLAATLAMALVLLAGTTLGTPFMEGGRSLGLLAWVISLAGVGAAVYLALSRLLGGDELELALTLRRGK